MHILLTNDDGIFAPGLGAMYKELTKIADVTVAAPTQMMSGASHSITLSPLTFAKVDITGKFIGYSVDGSPVDCVKLAVMELTKKPVDLVVSGINHGSNAGIHVHYSGTVGAAMEGAFSGIPSIAVSAAYKGETDFDLAAAYAIKVIESLLPMKKPEVININIPPLNNGKKPKGIKVVPHSTNIYDEFYSRKKDENGQTFYQYNFGNHRDKNVDTDVIALQDGYITVTALHFNMNDIEKNKNLKKTGWTLPEDED